MYGVGVNLAENRRTAVCDVLLIAGVVRNLLNQLGVQFVEINGWMGCGGVSKALGLIRYTVRM